MCAIIIFEYICDCSWYMEMGGRMEVEMEEEGKEKGEEGVEPYLSSYNRSYNNLTLFT